MATETVSSQHVRQVAELVRRLNEEEIRELLRLVPKLQVEAAAVGQPDDLVAWAREQLAHHALEAHLMQDEDMFLENKTVAEYFALPEEERERIWAEIYTAAIESAPEREVKPDAVVSAR
jgi:hypothetical protein